MTRARICIFAIESWSFYHLRAMRRSGFRTLVAAAIGSPGTRSLTVTGGQQFLLQLVPLGLIQHRFLTGRRKIMHRQIFPRRRRPSRCIGGQPHQGGVGDRRRAPSDREAKQQHAGQSRRLPNSLHVASHRNNSVPWSQSARFLLCERADDANLTSEEALPPDKHRRRANRVHEALI